MSKVLLSDNSQYIKANENSFYVKRFGNNIGFYISDIIELGFLSLVICVFTCLYQALL